MKWKGNAPGKEHGDDCNQRRECAVLLRGNRKAGRFVQRQCWQVTKNMYAAGERLFAMLISHTAELPFRRNPDINLFENRMEVHGTDRRLRACSVTASLPDDVQHTPVIVRAVPVGGDVYKRQ